MRENLEQRAEELAVYIIENRATIRAAAKHFGVSKSTVHKDLSERLEQVNRSLWQQAKKILEQNKAERHIRGGNATRAKYEKAAFRPDVSQRETQSAPLSVSRIHKLFLAFLGSFPHIIYREAGNPKFSRQSVPAAATVRPPVFPLDANRFSGSKKFFQKTA